MRRTVPDLLDHAEQQFGDRPFFGSGQAGVGLPAESTFAPFVRAVRALGLRLQAAGVQSGDRVAVLLPHGRQEAVSILAAMQVGAIAVPIHGKLKDDQVRHVLADAEPRVVVASADRTVGLADGAGVLAPYAVLDAEAGIGLQPHERDQVEVGAGHRPVAASDPAVLLYTSGSTGRAKGIVQTHENLVRGTQIVAGFLDLVPNDHILALLSFSFDYGLNQLMTALLVGCQLTAADHLGVAELANLLQAHRPTGLAGVPSLWHEVAQGLATGALTDEHARSLRYITNSGGALRPSDSSVLRTHWPQVAVFAMYGLTEAFRSAYLPPAEFDQHPESFGRAIDGVELLLVHPQTGEVMAGPATGELVHAGALVAAGYWRRPEQTARRFRRDPRPGRQHEAVVYSGDLVRRDEHGRHSFVSRMDRMLKVQGHRVSPDEVARAVAGMEAVSEVAVLGVSGGAEGHRIVMFVVPAAGSTPELVPAVRRRCRAQLPSYMQPSQVLVLEQLPQNQNAKVDHGALRAMLDACTDNT